MRVEAPVHLVFKLAWATAHGVYSTGSRGLESVLRRVALSGPVNRIVDSQLDRLLEPVVDRAMPIVLDKLGQEREQVLNLVREHGDDLTGELVAGVRDRAEAADDTAERVVRRLLRLRQEGAPPQTGLQPAPPQTGLQPAPPQTGPQPAPPQTGPQPAPPAGHGTPP
jgi:hypothetical protein